jgi:hypothetical protein
MAYWIEPHGSLCRHQPPLLPGLTKAGPGGRVTGGVGPGIGVTGQARATSDEGFSTVSNANASPSAKAQARNRR